MKSSYTIFLLCICYFATIECRRSIYQWYATSLWSDCSKSCGQGIQNQIFTCVRNTSYNTLEPASEKLCKNVPTPKEIRNCSYGLCSDKLQSTFIWRVSNWSSCSKSCGRNGYQSRDVNCYLTTYNEHTNSPNYLLTKLSKCQSNLEPKRYLKCGDFDCPPLFITTKWNKCPLNDNCEKTIQKRDVQCGTQLINGTIQVVSKSYCYQRRLRPPKQWKYCYNSLNNLKCHEKMSSRNISTAKITIIEEDAEIHQMKTSKRKIKVYAGQKAFIFSHTKVLLICPVKESWYPKYMIKWYKKSAPDQIYLFQRNSKIPKPKSRSIFVNKRGILKIYEFKISHQGQWICQAGSSKSAVALNYEMPSTGFSNWLSRYANRNYGMLNEDSKLGYVKPVSVTWMKSEWTKCPWSCNSTRTVASATAIPKIQTRKVTCEKIEPQFFKVIPDSNCHEPKPISQRPCKVDKICPQWVIQTNHNRSCTNECIDWRTARTNEEAICTYYNRSVDKSLCESMPVPWSRCVNEDCRSLYVTSHWSQCSLSCSNNSAESNGVMNRVTWCVWQHNRTLLAYDLCEKNSLEKPKLSKTCSVPPCILGCVDLSSSCSKHSKYRCRSSLFFHYCCAFCRKHYPRVNYYY